MLVLPGEPEIWPDLGSRIAQPHGVDVSSVDKSTWIAVFVLAEMHGGIEGVRETVLEHPAQLGVGELRSDLGDLGFHCFGHEKAVSHCGPARNKVLGSGIKRIQEKEKK